MTGGWGTHSTVLVVDDDRSVRVVVARSLERAGYLVHAVADGAAALAFAADGSADLVILDLVMPGLDGLETCRRLRALPGWETVPVLILTGTGENTLFEKAVDSGADDFLTKPVMAPELLLRVKSLLRIRSLLGGLEASAATIRAQHDAILQAKEIREKLEAFLFHDLKNPISSVLLQAEMMLEREGLDDSPWKRVFHHAQRLMTLVTGWMDYLRSEQAGIRPNLAPVELAPFLASVLGHHELWFKVRRLEGLVAVAPELSAHPLDPVLIDRVLGNLLDNCIRYSPEGGEIRLEAVPGPEGALRIAVTDRGPGVPAAQRETLFDLGVQLQNATAASGHRRENRGLGLAFCKAAVAGHGGTIWVEDNPGGGSRFVLQFPPAP